jgi:hypothetical protein
MFNGRPGMRTAAFVVAGLGASGLGIAAFADGNRSEGATQPEDPFQTVDTAPTWASHARRLTDVVVIVALLAVIVRLALPASRRFFAAQPRTITYSSPWAQAGYPAYWPVTMRRRNLYGRSTESGGPPIPGMPDIFGLSGTVSSLGIPVTAGISNVPGLPGYDPALVNPFDPTVMPGQVGAFDPTGGPGPNLPGDEHRS